MAQDCEGYERNIRREVLEARTDGRGEECKSQSTAKGDSQARSDCDTDQTTDDVVRTRPATLILGRVQLLRVDVSAIAVVRRLEKDSRSRACKRR